MLAAALRTMRPHQWVKNSFVLAPFFFAGEFFYLTGVVRAGVALGLFCLASSAVYVLNDLVDVESDRAHPVKRHRPIASGALPQATAWMLLGVLAATALGGGAALGLPFAGWISAYLILNVAYSSRLKQVAYVDVLCIATGFELRVLGGAAAAEVPPSGYLLVVTFLLASFLGFGKRMHELMQGSRAHKQRSVLQAYRAEVLHVLLVITALATLMVYGVYTLDPTTHQQLGSAHLVWTSGFTLFGLGRFLHLVRSQSRADSPTEEMLRDRPFLINLVLWALSVVAMLYVARAQ